MGSYSTVFMSFTGEKIMQYFNIKVAGRGSYIFKIYKKYGSGAGGGS